MEQKPVEANLPVVNATEKKHTNRGLIAILCVIGVIIVGLVVAIVVVRMKGEEIGVPDVNDAVTPSVAALTFADNIDEKLASGDGYSLDDANNDYRNAFEQASGNLKVNIAFNYANFLAAYNGDIKGAIDILESVKEEASDAGLLDDCYFALYDYYKQYGDIEKSNYYMDSFKELRNGDANAEQKNE